MSMIQQYLGRGVHKSWAQGHPAIKFCMVAPNVCGSSVWNFLRITLSMPKTSRSLACIFFGNICITALERLLL